MSRVRSIGWRRGVVTAGLAALAVATAGTAADYETPSSRPVREAIPADLAAGPGYTVRDPVGADGYMYHFVVDSSYGVFDVIGIGALRKLAREIWAIGELKQITGSEVFLKSLASQATKPVQFAKNVITKPGETLTGVPKGVGRLMSNVSTSISSDPDPSQDSRAKELLLVGGFKRDYATRYGVDPYSSNKVLQDELDKIGKAAAFGSWTATAAMMPIGGAAGTVLTATGLSQSFNNVLKNEPPSRIRTINEEKLKQMGIPSDLAKRYLDHPIYTPRHDLILVDSLARLGTAIGRDAYLKAALAAQDEDEAVFFVNTAQIMRGYHEMVGPVTRITMVNALPVVQARSGAAIIPFALDYGVWTANADKVSQYLKTSYRAPGFNKRFELWVLGTLSPMANQELKARGFAVMERASTRFEVID